MPKPGDEQPHPAAAGVDPRTPVQVGLELHEAIGLCILFSRSPDHLSMVVEDIDYGRSVDTANLKLVDEVARIMDFTDIRLEVGAARAKLDQLG